MGKAIALANVRNDVHDVKYSGNENSEGSFLIRSFIASFCAPMSRNRYACNPRCISSRQIRRAMDSFKLTTFYKYFCKCSSSDFPIPDCFPVEAYAGVA
jgi:hypothetical protein